MEKIYIPFLVMPVSYVYAMRAGLYNAWRHDIFPFAVSLSWLPIAIMVMFIVAQQKKNKLFASLGIALHSVFTCFVFSTFYFSFIKYFHNMGFVNRDMGYKINSIILLVCIILVFMEFISCKKKIM